VLAAACVSALVVNANTSAVTILLPSISEDVGAPVAELQWAVTGYSLVGAAVIVTSGALGDVLGRRKVFIGGLALFIGSCVLIALSTAAAGVVGGRMIQGASGATILACGMSLLSVASSGQGQMKAITLWGAASAFGAAAGPLIGGLLVDSTGWQGLFWIDAAIAAACIPITTLHRPGIPRSEPAAHDRYLGHLAHCRHIRPARSRAQRRGASCPPDRGKQLPSGDRGGARSPSRAWAVIAERHRAAVSRYPPARRSSTGNFDPTASPAMQSEAWARPGGDRPHPPEVRPGT